MEPLQIWLAGTVRGKGRPRFVRSTGHAYTPPQTVNYEAALRLAAQDAMQGKPPMDGPLTVTITAFFEIPKSYSRLKRIAIEDEQEMPTKKPDLDNIAKLSDALNQVVWIDDKQIVDAHLRKRYAAAPGLLITVRQI